MDWISRSAGGEPKSGQPGLSAKASPGDDGCQSLQMTPRFTGQGKRARVGAKTGLISNRGNSNIGKLAVDWNHQISSTRSSKSCHWSPSHSPSLRSSFCSGFGLEAHPAAKVKAQRRISVFKRFAPMWEIKHVSACHSRLFLQRRARDLWQCRRASSSAGMPTGWPSGSVAQECPHSRHPLPRPSRDAAKTNAGGQDLFPLNARSSVQT